MEEDVQAQSPLAEALGEGGDLPGLPASRIEALSDGVFAIAMT